ncbi:HAMP domain-containing histidine kinase [Streptomyces sp. ET3-23]|uniref:sensor histidine kinase n=1 Tax=Streptomyces sp. ET3-23 TaxID=2885643 RepID=UPI001D1137B0|nr:HAMP domain-containing sensor histidine kinase [Streptomyces sp. ET3-23]MCC2280142.1 HAMP domain-containing histidine kinase [Streptomyces sp. ET3-23]
MPLIPRKASRAATQLHRSRWVTTLLFAATTALCLVALATFAVRLDADSRNAALDHEAGVRAIGLSRAVWSEAGTVHLEPLREDELTEGVESVTILRRGTGGAPDARVAAGDRAALPDRADLGRIWQRLLTDQETVIRFTAQADDGRRLRWAVSPVWDQRIDAAVLVGLDPARQEHAHHALVQRLALGCAALVAVAATAGHLLSRRAMRPALQGLDRQEQFLAEAAHELRTPLATLRLVVEQGTTATDRAPAALGTALGLVDRLSRLVTGLLARARVEAGIQEAELTPLRLDQVVELTVDELPDRTGVTVHTEPAVVRGDPELLAQAVRNLVENALRHGGTEPCVEVTVARGLVAVRDHGPGVPLQDRDKVFRRGVSGVSGVSGDGGGSGTGTGLAIVRWVAQLHGGTARLSDAPGGGLLAELRLPPHEEKRAG